MPRLLRLWSLSWAADAGLVQSAGGALSTVIGVAMKPALMIRTANGLPRQSSDCRQTGAFTATLTMPSSSGGVLCKSPAAASVRPVTPWR
jgi:hypothetical protein